ncbi:uncharacterized protein K444DRAFT_515379, partial [Hyaloscypha bicolor E]
FKVIRKILEDPAIFLENIYNINKTGIILYILGSIKILINKNNLQNYKDISIKYIIVTIIKYINTNNKSLLLIII